MNDTQQITFVGPGVMAEAMISGLIRNRVAPPEAILVSGPNETRCEELVGRYGVGCTYQVA